MKAESYCFKPPLDCYGYVHFHSGDDYVALGGGEVIPAHTLLFWQSAAVGKETQKVC